MSDSIVRIRLEPPIAFLALNDPARRNAMTLAMFDALDEAIATIAGDDSLHVVLLRGEGAAFCAGFDLAAAAADPSLTPRFVERLSRVNRSLRRMPQVVVAAAHGAAIAGGCAMLSACDYVFVAADAALGYPVHRLGISPAVTIPTLGQAIGAGAARSLLMSGELIDGAAAHRLGLATHLVPAGRDPAEAAEARCRELAGKGSKALRVTKAWLNELDGSLDDRAFTGAASASAASAASDEARTLLASWQRK